MRKTVRGRYLLDIGNSLKSERDVAGLSGRVRFRDDVDYSKALLAVVGLVTAGVQLLRLLVTGDIFSKVWAEDGKILLGDARAHGFSSLFYTYSGYASELPRGIALIGSWLPLDSYSAYCVVTSALVSALLAAFIFDRALRQIRSKGWAAVAAVVIGLGPALRVESLGNIINLQWLLVYAAFWAVLGQGSEDSRSRQFLTVIVVFVAGISTPLTLLVFPALFVRAGWWRQHRSSVLAICAAMAIQAGLIEFGSRDVVGVARHPGLNILLLKQSLLGLAGYLPIPNYVTASISVLIGAGIAYVWYRLRSQRDVVAALVAGLLLFVVTAGITGDVGYRYAATADLFAVAALALAAPHLSVPLKRFVALGMVSVALIGFPATAYRLSGPSWPAGVASYSRGCARGLQEIKVPVSPAGWGAVTLFCPKKSSFARLGHPEYRTGWSAHGPVDLSVIENS